MISSAPLTAPIHPVMRIRSVACLAAIGICLFLGFWAFAYHGYTEDAGSEPVQSWPYGAGLFLAAGLAAATMIRARWPALSGLQLLGIAFLLLALLGVAALGALDAGGNSFEF